MEEIISAEVESLPIAQCNTTNDNIEVKKSLNQFNYVPECPSINIEFQELGYSVPDLNGNNKSLLRGISGKFESSQLTVIMGPSGAGKTTLLNVLAGYRTRDPTGNILVNGKPRNMKIFRKISRYIMQEDLYQPLLTIKEAMMIAADLKLGKHLTKQRKLDVINEILEQLRLTSAADTMSHLLSGGERKRLSIALELVNNPPVIFLDEPTTGLDDLSSAQCIQLLQKVAHGGRTIICSIHTPSAKCFKMFDRVYIMSDGQCTYQGNSLTIVSYLQTVGLNCPIYYNPADFVIEVSCGEYGDEYVEQMIEKIDNGKNCWTLESKLEIVNFKNKNNNNNSNNNNNNNNNSVTNGVESLEISIDISNNNNNNNSNSNSKKIEDEIDPMYLTLSSSYWYQFTVLFRRRWIQTLRDSTYTKLRIYATVILGTLVGFVYQGMGNDASKAIFNFGLCFTFIVAFLYLPLMPVLLQFPAEVQLLKREYFNRWFRIGPYYLALIASKLPMTIFLTFALILVIYVLSEQPLELFRIAMFYSTSLMIGLTSESFGLIIASRFNLVNGMFLGPAAAVPIMLLSVYGMGFGKETVIPIYIKILMSLSYLRYGLEGLVAAMYGYDRANTICPDTEVYCIFSNSKFLRTVLGFENVSFPYAITGLIINYLLFSIIAFYMMKFRISTAASNYVVVQYASRFVKKYFNLSLYKY